MYLDKVEFGKEFSGDVISVVYYIICSPELSFLPGKWISAVWLSVVILNEFQASPGR